MSVTREAKVQVLTSVSLSIEDWAEIRKAAKVFGMPVLQDLIDEAQVELQTRRDTWRARFDCDVCNAHHNGARMHDITASFIGEEWHRSLVREVRGYVNDGTVQRMFPNLHGILADILLQIDE